MRMETTTKSMKRMNVCCVCTSFRENFHIIQIHVLWWRCRQNLICEIRKKNEKFFAQDYTKYDFLFRLALALPHSFWSLFCLPDVAKAAVAAPARSIDDKPATEPNHQYLMFIHNNKEPALVCVRSSVRTFVVYIANVVEHSQKHLSAPFGLLPALSLLSLHFLTSLLFITHPYCQQDHLTKNEKKK